MIAVYLPPAWFALIPIILIESAYGIWRFKTPTAPTVAVVATANCVSTLVGLPVTWILLALGQTFLFERFTNIAATLPLGVLTVVGAAWLGPEAEQSAWMVPVALATLTAPFYAMSVACEYLVVMRFMPDLPRRTIRSWMLGANAVSYAFLSIIMLSRWMWPKAFERLAAIIFPVTMWCVESVFRLAALLQGR